MLSRRANISVVVLVVLVLGLVAMTLLTLNNSSGKIVSKFYVPYFLEELKFQQGSLEDYVSQISEVALIQTYSKLLISGDYVSPLRFSSDWDFYFSELHPQLEDNFKSMFLDNLKIENKKYSFEDEDFLKIQEKIQKGDFEFETFSNGISLVFEDVEFKAELGEDSEEIISLKQDVKSQVLFSELGLFSFQEFYDEKEKCKSLPDKNKCFEGFSNFIISYNDELRKFGFSSEKKYWIYSYEGNLKFEKLGFGFVIPQ